MADPRVELAPPKDGGLSGVFGLVLPGVFTLDLPETLPDGPADSGFKPWSKMGGATIDALLYGPAYSYDKRIYKSYILAQIQSVNTA